MRHQGKVKNISTEQNSGFITPENGDKDIYFIAAEVREGIESLQPGYLVSFTINTNENNFLFANKIELVYKRGKVNNINDKKRGSIYSDDGEVYSFIGKEVKDSLKVGDRVTFSIGISKSNKKYANQVSKLETQEISASDPVSTKSGSPTCSDIKNGAIAQFEKILEITDPDEFEDAVYLLLNALGIKSLYQYDRKNQAGKADGFFTLAPLSVIYDCTLRDDYEEFKKQQYENFVGIVKKSEVTIESDSITISNTIKQVWIVTKGKTRLIKDIDDIKVKEVAVIDLIELLKMRFETVMKDSDLAMKLLTLDE